jgi:hypothetical protein
VPTHRVELCWAASNDAEPGLRWLIGEMEAAFLDRRWDKEGAAGNGAVRTRRAPR